MTKFNNIQVKKIYLPAKKRKELINHCLRKLNKCYLAGESGEQKAYGLIGGIILKENIIIQDIAPLYKTSEVILLIKDIWMK